MATATSIAASATLPTNEILEGNNFTAITNSVVGQNLQEEIESFYAVNEAKNIVIEPNNNYQEADLSLTGENTYEGNNIWAANELQNSVSEEQIESEDQSSTAFSNEVSTISSGSEESVSDFHSDEQEADIINNTSSQYSTSDDPTDSDAPVSMIDSIMSDFNEAVEESNVIQNDTETTPVETFDTSDPYISEAIIEPAISNYAISEDSLSESWEEPSTEDAGSTSAEVYEFPELIESSESYSSEEAEISSENTSNDSYVSESTESYSSYDSTYDSFTSSDYDSPVDYNNDSSVEEEEEKNSTYSASDGESDSLTDYSSDSSTEGLDASSSATTDSNSTGTASAQ
jgi:hypothetical protein